MSGSTAAAFPTGYDPATFPRVKVSRVMDADAAGKLVGHRADTHEPTVVDPGLYVDADTGEPVMGHLPLPDFATFRRVVLAVPFDTATIRSNSGLRNVSRTFGNRPRKPTMAREACAVSRLARDNPEINAFFAVYADQLADLMGAAFPEVRVAGAETVAAVLPEWRLTDDALWTSGVINKESSLPYHRDGNNFDAWSAMPVARRGVRGGHLHLPEYGMTVACRDAFGVFFAGRRLVHGVTPMRKVAADGYRISVVYYALRGLKDCHTFAMEQEIAQKRRTARERPTSER